MRLNRIIYCSRNRLRGSDETLHAEIGKILEVSRANNARDGLSGGLLFSDDCFVQVLEGPLAALQNAFERIQCDARHGEVTVIQTGPIASRDFPEWSMAFTGTIDASRAIGFEPEHAFHGRSADGDVVLRVMKDLVDRQRDWLAPAP